MRQLLFRVQGGHCYYCLKPMTWPYPARAFKRATTVLLSETDATLDHKTPVCRGGTDETDNLATCCMRCNTTKGTMTEKEYRCLTTASSQPG